jgi:hypothetical protein
LGELKARCVAQAKRLLARVCCVDFITFSPGFTIVSYFLSLSVFRVLIARF